MLTPEELEEFKTLWTHLGNDPEADETFTDHSRVYDRLHTLRRKARQILTCCQAIQHYPIVYGCVSEEGEWHWCLNGHSEIYSSMKLEQLQNLPEPVFCPFCATALPKMVRRNLVDMPVANEADEDYCSSCHERLHNCRCLPPIANWVPA